jgi:hypothetical protein
MFSLQVQRFFAVILAAWRADVLAMCMCGSWGRIISTVDYHFVDPLSTICEFLLARLTFLFLNWKCPAS